ncbi:hypothetical protein [Thermovibrio sp.]
MGKYLQGAAFYLFAYFILGLVNSGIMYFSVKVLHVIPVITLGFLLFFSFVVLFFAFKKSLELFILEGGKISEGRAVIAWTVHLILFIVVASLIEVGLIAKFGSPKIAKILTVFTNFIVFFSLYWLVVKSIVERGIKVEA